MESLVCRYVHRLCTVDCAVLLPNGLVGKYDRRNLRYSDRGQPLEICLTSRNCIFVIFFQIMGLTILAAGTSIPDLITRSVENAIV